MSDDIRTASADGRDPGNTDIEELIQPLEADDNVFTLVNPTQEVRELAPVHDPVYIAEDTEKP